MLAWLGEEVYLGELEEVDGLEHIHGQVALVALFHTHRPVTQDRVAQVPQLPQRTRDRRIILLKRFLRTQAVAHGVASK